MASSVRTGLPGTMSLIERTLNGEDPLDENGTAESPVPDFFMASWYSQCGTCGDSPVVMRPPALDKNSGQPSLDGEAGPILDLPGRIRALAPSSAHSPGAPSASVIHVRSLPS